MATTSNGQNIENEIQILKKLYAAIKANDAAAALAFFGPQIVRAEPPGFPTAQTYRGLTEMKAHFMEGRDSWTEGGCEPQEFIAAGDKIIVLAHVRVKLKSNQQWIEGDVADLFEFQDGKIIEFRTFLEKQHAFEWAGVKP